MALLTNHREGSLRELCSLSFPLMLSSFSVVLMMFVDRLLLAHYSTEAMNASVNATTLGWAFIGGWISLASIAEVFVAQYNGADKTEKLGEPVWQMIWLSFGSVLFFIPWAFWGADLFYGRGAEYLMERDYFHWMLFFGPSFTLYGALSAYFIGQGKTRLVTGLALLTNLVNAGLDVVLIFGIEGVIPSMGVKGAAIATSSSGVFQALVLGFIFLSRNHREKHGTADYAFKPAAFFDCIRIGLPSAIFVVIEILGWAAYYWMMTLIGERYITIVGICQSVVILFYFFGEGIGKAAMTLCGNFIGAGRAYLVPRVLSAGLRLHLIFFLFIMAGFFTCTDLLIEYFLPHASPQKIESLKEALLTCLYLTQFYLLFEGVRLLLAGVLTSAGDTTFLLIFGSLSVWVLLVLPVYLIVVKGGAPVETSALISVCYSFAACLLYFWRFWKGRWKEISIIN